jgi:putative FmdB family regulatory protein
MPTYSYSCNKCNKSFELFFYIKDYIQQPKCPLCSSKQTNRCYIEDVSTLSSSVKKADSELSNLGDLANRNRDRMSDDQKQFLFQKHNEYREDKSSTDLPSGMSRMKKQPKIKWTDNGKTTTNRRRTR